MRIAILPGDGIGPEITAAMMHVLHRVTNVFKLPIKMLCLPVGLTALSKLGSTLPAESRNAAISAEGVVLGPLSTYEYPPPEEGGINASSELRRDLNLFANIRPVRRYQPLSGTGVEVDLVIVRENTEGFYAVRSMIAGSGEFMPTANLALAIRKISLEASLAIATVGFELARQRRRHLTIVHKANVLKLSDGLFLRGVHEIGRNYPDVETDEVLVDAMAALLVREAKRFDVILTTNLFGDILSNEAAELAGGLGLAPSLNVGHDHAMAQASHGSAPDIAGKGIANPIALILSVSLLLDWLGKKSNQERFGESATAVRIGVQQLLESPSTRTADIKGNCRTEAFGTRLADLIGMSDKTRVS